MPKDFPTMGLIHFLDTGCWSIRSVLQQNIRSKSSSLLAHWHHLLPRWEKALVMVLKGKILQKTPLIHSAMWMSECSQRCWIFSANNNEHTDLHYTRSNGRGGRRDGRLPKPCTTCLQVALKLNPPHPSQVCHEFSAWSGILLAMQRNESSHSWGSERMFCFLQSALLPSVAILEKEDREFSSTTHTHKHFFTWHETTPSHQARKIK